MRDGGAYELALYGTHNYWGGGAVAFLEDGCLSAPSLLEYCPLCTGPGNTKALFGEGVPALHSVLATLTGRASLRDPYTGRASLLIGRASLLKFGDGGTYGTSLLTGLLNYATEALTGRAYGTGLLIGALITGRRHLRDEPHCGI